MDFILLTFAGLSSLYLKSRSLKNLAPLMKEDIKESSDHTRNEWCEQRDHFLTRIILHPTYMTLRMPGIEHKQSVKKGTENE